MHVARPPSRLPYLRFGRRGPAAAGYVCEFDGWPGYKWSSGSDDTDRFPGITCSKLETPLPGSTIRQWSNWRAIVQLIEDLPIP